MEAIQALQAYLTPGTPNDTTRAEIMAIRAEKAVNFEVLFASEVKNFRILQKMSEKRLIEAIVKLTARFLRANFPDVQVQEISIQFAADLVDTRPDWSLLDVLNFFKFVRQRQDLPECKVFGNRINVIKLNELVAVYESEKAVAREQYHKKQSMAALHTDVKLIGDGEEKYRFGELAQELAEKQRVKRQQESEAMYSNAGRTKTFLEAMRLNWEELMAAVDRGEISEAEAVKRHAAFREGWNG